MSGIVSWHPMGRLGNWLFTCAAVYAYSRKHDMGFSVPKTTNDQHWNPLYMNHLVNPLLNGYDRMIQEQTYMYSEMPWHEDWRNNNIMFMGYYQSWKYYDEYRNDLLNAFNLEWHHVPDVCSVHARFGDYLTIPGKHMLMNEGYLRAAISIIVEKTGIRIFKVFSDDIPYFKQHFGHIYDFDYSTNADILGDLVEASWCHSHINSASTFSYWVAEINKNPNKVVVCQKDFYQPGWADMDTSDVLRPEWIKIGNYGLD